MGWTGVAKDRRLTICHEYDTLSTALYLLDSDKKRETPMKFARYFFSIFFFVLSVPAVAGTSCYAPEQMRAEQLWRLHSELMVITVTCRQSSVGQSLSPVYTAFTRKNIAALHRAEQTMVAYYKKNEKGDPLEKLDRLRTKLGNEFGQKAADLSSPVYCSQFRDKVEEFYAATKSDIDAAIGRMTASSPSYAKACGKTVLAKRGR